MNDDIGRQAGSKRIGESLLAARDSTDRDRLELYEFGSFRLQPAERKLWHCDEVVVLTPKAFDTLVLLVRHSGHLLEKDELIRALWPDSFVEEGNLTNNISLLRKALGDDPPYIETVPKRGYRFIGAVRQLPKTDSASQEGRSAELELADGTIPERRRSVSAVAIDTVPTKGYRLLDAIELDGPPLPTIPRNKTNFRRWVAGVACLTALAAVFFARPHLAAPNLRNVIRLTNDGTLKLNLVTDGVRVYFNRQEANTWHVAQISVGGGEITDLPTIRDLFISDISQSGSELLLSGADQEDGPLSIYSLPGGPAKRVGHVMAHAAGFSPRADQIAYAQGNELWIVDREGTKPQRIRTIQGFPNFIRWSPDSSRLRFSINAKEEDTIWEIRTDGKGLHQLLTSWSTPSAESDGSWTKDGKYFIFAAGRGGVPNLWTIREKDEIWHKVSHVPTQLTSGTLPVWNAAPSPDVGRLFALAGTDRVEVVRYDSRNKQFSRYPYRLSAIHLDFSRDERWITYSEYPEWTLLRSKVDGTEKLELTPPDLQVMWPTFSPNGRKIAFAGRRVGETRHIYSISLDGGDFEQLTNGEDEEGPPTWSPDGSTIAFASVSEPTEDRERIQFVDVGSKRVRSLPGANRLFLFQWSIDGKFLVALSDDGRPYLVDPNSGQATRLADIAIHRPYLSPDSKYIYFTAGIKKESAIYRVSITTRKLERIASLGDSIRMTAVAPDGTLLAVRDVGDTDIYALDWNAP